MTYPRLAAMKIQYAAHEAIQEVIAAPKPQKVNLRYVLPSMREWCKANGVGK